jgi:signal transduction histidine kinase/CheY-like chemotaxis protein
MGGGDGWRDSLGLRLAQRIIVSFETKVVGLSVVGTVVALLLAFGAFQWQDWRADRADLVTEQVGLAQLIGSQVAPPAENSRNDHLAIVAAIAAGSGNIVSVTWLPASGGRQQLYGPKQAGDAPRFIGVSGQVSQFDDQGLLFRTPYVDHGHVLGELMIRAHDPSILSKLVRNSLVALLLAIGATLVSGLLGRMLVRRSLRPLHLLDQGIEAVRVSHDFKDRVTVTSNDEFGRLTDNFNAMLVELDTYDVKLRGNVRDLTEARDAAEAANVLKSQFLANMSHEIRTPLNGVLGMAQAMAMGKLEPAQHQQLDVIATSGAALLSILDNILDLSKIEAGGVEVEWAPFDIGEVAAGACDLFTSMADAKGLSLVLDVDEEARGAWRGDAGRVRQLICNLVSNGLKFTHQGSVRVHVQAPLRDADRTLMISVSDTGIGIAPDVLEKVFERFVQADGATTRSFGGSGLGLTICRHIVGMMGGDIEARSDLGHGATFVVKLPLAWLGDNTMDVPEDEVGGPASSADLSSLRILAVDDNDTNRLVVKTLLQAVGIVPVMAENGRQAVEAWKAGSFDIVLMDIQMPVLDGVSATREIRSAEAERGLARTPIIAVTANVMTDQIESYMAAGVDDYLPKPIDAAAFYDKIFEIVTEHADESEVVVPDTECSSAAAAVA